MANRSGAVARTPPVARTARPARERSEQEREMERSEQEREMEPSEQERKTADSAAL